MFHVTFVGFSGQKTRNLPAIRWGGEARHSLVAPLRATSGKSCRLEGGFSISQLGRVARVGADASGGQWVGIYQLLAVVGRLS